MEFGVDGLVVLALGVLLAAMAVQDVKRREVDLWLPLAAAVPAALTAWWSWGPVYAFSLAAGLALALLMRVMGMGYADSLAIALAGAAPPPAPFLPTAFLVLLAGGCATLPAVMAWLYLLNSRRPCAMSPRERLTHICVSREEYLRSPLKYLVGNVKDVERYVPPAEVGEWTKARYGMPFVASIAVGYGIYLATYFLL